MCSTNFCYQINWQYFNLMQLKFKKMEREKSEKKITDKIFVTFLLVGGGFRNFTMKYNFDYNKKLLQLLNFFALTCFCIFPLAKTFLS